MEDISFELGDPQQPAESCSTNRDMYSAPQVMHSHQPVVGQEFDSLDDAYRFYNEYAREVGFGVRIGSSLKNRANEITRKEYVCYKEGQRRNKNGSEKKRVREETREDCRAKLAVVKDTSSSKYKVSVFIEQHSHALATPKKVALLRSHRRVSNTQRSLTQQLTASNIPTRQQMSTLELQAGGSANIGCTKRNIRTLKRDSKKGLVGGHDADMLKEYFLWEKEKNPAFSFAIETDSNKYIRRCFWADAISRRAYKCFGDVVIFGTTHDTNRYGMIFAPLLGVNHHGQTILLGCGFLSDETTYSFLWLFEQWLKAMPGNPPNMIITEQDPAMAKAISQVLPKTFHRFSIWHILKEFSEKLSASSYMAVCTDFQCCIWDSESQVEFDTRWMEVIEKGGLQNNGWLKSMFELRSKWVPAYVKHIFSAGLSCSQRADAASCFFKRYIKKENSLFDFVTCFDRELAKQRRAELEADHKDIDEQPILKTRTIMETQLAAIYTHTIFKKFQDEVFQCVVYGINLISEGDVHCVYEIKHATEAERARKILVDKRTKFVSCSCQLFEWEGIPCRHMVAYFNSNQVFELPEKYIKKRWTRAAKLETIIDEHGVECISSLILRRASLYNLFKNVLDMAMLSEEQSKRLEELLLSMRAQIKAIPIENCQVSTQSITPHSQVSSNLKDEDFSSTSAAPLDKSFM